MSHVLQDVAFAWRSFRRTPGAAVLAIATIAIGVGANAAIYSVIRSVLLDPLPYPRSERLAILWRSNPAIAGVSISPSADDVAAWRRASSLEGLTVYSSRSLTLTGGSEPEQVIARQIEPGLFDFFGVRPVLGRPFTSEEAASAAAAHVALLGEPLWRHRFGADPAIVGRSITLSDERYTVIGVMGADFRLPLGKGDLWIPFVAQAGPRAAVGLNAIGRVRAGVSTKAAEDELSGLMGQTNMRGVPGRWQARLMAPAALAGETFRRALLVLLGAVAFVLLIGCANVAALILARNNARAREIAVRVALGASRGRLIRQLLTESLMLAFAGGAAGVLIAIWILQGLSAIRPAQMDQLAYVRPSAAMFAVTAGLSLLTGLLFGIAPAWSGTRIALSDALKAAGRGTSVRRGTAARRTLTVVEIALSCLLLIGAGLLIRSYARMLATDPGFQPSHRVAMHVALPEKAYATDAAKARFFGDLLASVRSLPGVERAAFGSGVPPGGGIIFGTLEFEGQPVLNGGAPAALAGGSVSPGYFSTLGIPVRDGREFVDTDLTSGTRVAIVNETAASRYFHGQSALGKRLRLSKDGPWATIIGVVGDLKGNAKSFGDVAVYQPITPPEQSDATVVVAATGDPAALVSRLKSQVWALDAALPVTNVTTLEAAMAETMSRPRFNLVLLGGFALVGLVLAAIGIYGVISASVGQRTQEIGVRMALGAVPRDIRRAVLGEALAMTGIGLAAGVLLSLGVTRVMRAMLFETSALDAMAITATVAILGLTALVAAWVPAHRAMRVDPMIALRAE